jgi:hypothetical protein
MIELDERLETALEAYRKDHEDSQTDTVLREALEEFLIEHGYLTRKRKVPKSVGSVRSDVPDLPYRDEELLWSER